jgi:hypothetical protein
MSLWVLPEKQYFAVEAAELLAPELLLQKLPKSSASILCH